MPHTKKNSYRSFFVFEITNDWKFGQNCYAAELQVINCLSWGSLATIIIKGNKSVSVSHKRDINPVDHFHRNIKHLQSSVLASTTLSWVFIGVENTRIWGNFLPFDFTPKNNFVTDDPHFFPNIFQNHLVYTVKLP
jgi:hypothetical protein